MTVWNAGPAYQMVIYTRCCIDAINSPDDGHMAALKHVENRNKHIRKNCASGWFVYKKDYQLLAKTFAPQK